jgi:hypothetical protein
MSQGTLAAGSSQQARVLEMKDERRREEKKDWDA